MKKFFQKLEEIWITATFAEESIYESDLLSDRGNIGIYESIFHQKSS